MNRPENQVCSDCPEKQPRWASLIVPPPGSPPGSLPIGAFCCLECSGSHRRLGVHISFVRSVNLDQWKEREVQAMENGGNKKVNAIFESKLGPYSDAKKPTTGASGPERERFIRDKYERRKYFDSSVLQRYYEEASDEDSESEEEEPSRKPTRQTKAVVRAPSDAARRRAEARRSRQEATQSAGASRKVAAPKRPVASRPPAPAPAPEVDLLNFDAVPAAPDPPLEPPEPSPTASPKLDLFANMSISNGEVQNASDAATSAVQQKMISDQRKSKNDEILAMFNTPHQQQPQQQGFGDFGAFNNNVGAVANPGMQNMNAGGTIVNNPNSGVMMMGGFPQQMPQGGAVAMQQKQNAQGRNMMMMQNNKGNTTMMMQQRSDSGTLNTMMMQQQQQQMGGMGMNQQGIPMGGGMSQQGIPMGAGGMGGMGMGISMSPQQQQQQSQFNMMNNQMPMGGMATAGGNQLMGGQPMGGQVMPGQMMGGQPMGGQAVGTPMASPSMGGDQRKTQSDQFSEFSPW